MSVFKRKGSSYFQYKFLYQGEAFRGSCGTADKRTAEAFERKVRARVEQQALNGKLPEITLDAAFARYVDEVAQHQASFDSVAQMIERMAPALGKNKSLTEIDDPIIARYIAKRRTDKARHKTTLVSNATVNRETEFLHRVMTRAGSLWKVQVAHPNWRAHALPEADEREVTLPADSFARLLAHIHRQDFHPLFKAAHASGMRLNNLTTLRWSQVDEAAGVIRLRLKSKKQNGREVVFPLAGEMAAIVAGQRGQHPELVFTYVVHKKRGKRVAGTRAQFTATGWRKIYYAARKAAGLPELRFHDLRHAFGNAIYATTKNLKVVQRAMGHSDISSTMRYLHADIGDVRAGLQAMAPAPVAVGDDYIPLLKLVRK